MPPAISDDEKSDAGDIAVPMPLKSTFNTNGVGLNDEDDDEMLDVVGNDTKDDQDENEAAHNDDDEDLEEDEYIVEKILAHVLEADGSLKYKVKWEGYEKKADQTWEDEENLRENATLVLDEYLASVGGRDKIIEEAQTGLKTKKRGRPAAGAPANGTKRRRNDSHPASATPPTSARAWKPPQGSWEDDVESIDACHDENTGKLIVFLTWKNGQKTQHDTKVIYQRCPQKMLQYYERHVKIVPTGSEAVKEE
ncbi:heterochromatin protein one [Xylariaceae sp. FL1651]|nr:heterochromatin protein one [Xylariaceae sp. FL1651]